MWTHWSLLQNGPILVGLLYTKDVTNFRSATAKVAHTWGDSCVGCRRRGSATATRNTTLSDTLQTMGASVCQIRVLRYRVRVPTCNGIAQYTVIPGNRNWQIETADWNLHVRLDIWVKKLYASLEILLRNWLVGSKTVVSISRDDPL